MIMIQLSHEKAERHSRLLRRAVLHLEELRRLAAFSTGAAIGEIQQSLREIAELLEGGSESVRLEEVTCADCGRSLRPEEARGLGCDSGWLWVCRDRNACRELQGAPWYR